MEGSWVLLVSSRPCSQMWCVQGPAGLAGLGQGCPMAERSRPLAVGGEGEGLRARGGPGTQSGVASSEARPL